MTNRLERRAHDDRGFAMITALLVVVVAAFLGATAVAIATHDQDASARDRARTQSIHAAEAGIDTTLKTISASSLTTLPCTTSGSTTDSPVATWNVEVDY